IVMPNLKVSRFVWFKSVVICFVMWWLCGVLAQRRRFRNGSCSVSWYLDVDSWSLVDLYHASVD
ncbi:hypothetical protein A2U01_0054547, partial [Trifolium medium]|nr:hypothetical protein [Trifolium medium]